MSEVCYVCSRHAGLAVQYLHHPAKVLRFDDRGGESSVLVLETQGGLRFTVDLESTHAYAVFPVVRTAPTSLLSEVLEAARRDADRLWDLACDSTVPTAEKQAARDARDDLLQLVEHVRAESRARASQRRTRFGATGILAVVFILMAGLLASPGKHPTSGFGHVWVCSRACVRSAEVVKVVTARRGARRALSLILP